MKITRADVHVEKKQTTCSECGKRTVDLPVGLEITYSDCSVKSTNLEEWPLCLSCFAVETHGSYQASKRRSKFRVD